MISLPLKDFIKKYLLYRATKSNYKFVLKDWISLKDLKAVSRVLETKRFSQNLDPIIMSRPKARRALVIAPHPDDDVFSSGGTILKLIQSGCRVKVIYLTSGSSNLAQRLEEESKEVSKNLGTDIEFWRNETRRIAIDAKNINRLKKIYMEFRPNILFIPFIADDHDDHRCSVQLFYESFKDSKELNSEVWAYQIYSTVLPNLVVDITDEIEEKTRLINLWKTIRIKRDWAHYIRGLNAFNSRFLKTKEARYAEPFFVVPAREYIELCSLYFNAQR